MFRVQGRILENGFPIIWTCYFSKNDKFATSSFALGRGGVVDGLRLGFRGRWLELPLSGVNLGASMLRIGFWGHYTIIMTRSPKTAGNYLGIEAPILRANLEPSDTVGRAGSDGVRLSEENKQT